MSDETQGTEGFWVRMNGKKKSIGIGVSSAVIAALITLLVNGSQKSTAATRRFDFERAQETQRLAAVEKCTSEMMTEMRQLAKQQEKMDLLMVFKLEEFSSRLNRLERQGD